MKRLIVLFAFLLVGIGLMAQDQIINVRGQASLYNTTTTAARKVAAYNYTFMLKDMPAPYLYTYSVRLQDLGGAPKNNYATVVLSGSLDGYEYKAITTITLGAKTCPADTALIGNITSAPLSYRFLKFTITPADTIWVKGIYLNVLPNTLP